jgi:lactoylglutathione lyase
VSARQLKVGLRVSDLERSATLYRQLGFRTIPVEAQPARRYLTYGHTWLILSDRFQRGYHEAGREALARSGPLGRGSSSWCRRATSTRCGNSGAGRACR